MWFFFVFFIKEKREQCGCHYFVLSRLCVFVLSMDGNYTGSTSIYTAYIICLISESEVTERLQTNLIVASIAFSVSIALVITVIVIEMQQKGKIKHG